MPGKGAFVVAHSLPAAAALAKLCKQRSAQRHHARHNGDDRGNLRVRDDQAAHLGQQPACTLCDRAKAAHAPGKACDFGARIDGKVAHARTHGAQHTHDLAADVGNVDVESVQDILYPTVLAQCIAQTLGNTVRDAAADIPRLLRNVADLIAQYLVQPLDEVLPEVINELLAFRRKAVVQGGQHPLPDGLPVLAFYGSSQRAEGAQHALVGFLLPALHKAGEISGGGFLQCFCHLLGAVGGDGLYLLHRAQRTVDDGGVGFGDGLFLALGAVGQGLGHGLGGGADAIHQRLIGRGDRGGKLPHRFHGLLHGLFSVCADGGNSLDILQHTVHQLTAGLGDGLFLLLLAVGEHLVGGLGGAGDLAQHLGDSVGVGADHRGRRGGLGRCRSGSVPGLGIGRDCDLRHSLGAAAKACVGTCPAGSPVVPFAAGGLGQRNTGRGSGGGIAHNFALAGQTLDKALYQVFVSLLRLRGQALDPAQRAGKAALEGGQHTGTHALYAVRHAGEDVLADVQPVDGRDHRQHRLQDLLPVGQQGRHGLYDARDQLHDDGDTLRKDLGHIVVDDARNVDDDIRHIGDQLRQTGNQAVEQLGDAVKPRIHKLPRVGAQLLGKGEQLRQGSGKKRRDALRKARRQTADQLRAGLEHLRYKAVHQLRDARQHVADHGQQVALQKGAGGICQRLHGRGQVCTGAPVSQHVLRRRLHGCKAAGQGGGGFLCRGAGDVQIGLDNVDGAVHIRQIAQIVVYTGELLCIGQQPLHLCLRAAVAELEVVEPFVTPGFPVLKKPRAFCTWLSGIRLYLQLFQKSSLFYHGRLDCFV